MLTTSHHDGLQLRARDRIQAVGTRLLQKRAIAPSAARLCWVRFPPYTSPSKKLLHTIADQHPLNRAEGNNEYRFEIGSAGAGHHKDFFKEFGDPSREQQ